MLWPSPIFAPLDVFPEVSAVLFGNKSTFGTSMLVLSMAASCYEVLPMFQLLDDQELMFRVWIEHLTMQLGTGVTLVYTLEPSTKIQTTGSSYGDILFIFFFLFPFHQHFI